MAAPDACERATAADLDALGAMQQAMETHHRRGELMESFKLTQRVHPRIVDLADTPVASSIHGSPLMRIRRRPRLS